MKAGFEKDKAAVLVVMAALSDGKKVVVSAVPGYEPVPKAMLRPAWANDAHHTG